MKKIFAFILTLFSITFTYAQQAESDFQNKLKPEYRLELGTVNQEPQKNIEKSDEELEKELALLKTQKSKISAEIAALEASGTPKDDNMYLKLQFALKSLNSQISSREKFLNSRK